MDEITFALHNPLTEEEWDAIEDIDFDHTNSITFHTKHGKDVEFVKRKTGRWIPCSERLPFAEYGESDNVLATCGHRDGEDTSVRWIKTLYFNGGNWCYPTGETYEQKVYAWMPLPEPYKEGES